MVSDRRYKRNFIILENEDSGFEKADKKVPKGYAKLEVRNGKGLLNVYVQDLKYFKDAKYIYRNYLISTKGKKGLFVNTGTFIIDEKGKGELKVKFNPDNVEGSGRPIEEFNVVAVIAEPIERSSQGKEIYGPLVGYMDKDNGKINWKDVIVYKENEIKKDNDIDKEYKKKYEEIINVIEKSSKELYKEENKTEDNKKEEEIQENVDEKVEEKMQEEKMQEEKKDKKEDIEENNEDEKESKNLDFLEDKENEANTEKYVENKDKEEIMQEKIEEIIEPKEEIKPEQKEKVQPQKKEQIKAEQKEQIEPKQNEYIKPEQKEQIKPKPKEDIKPENKEEVKPQQNQEMNKQQKEEAKSQNEKVKAEKKQSKYGFGKRADVHYKKYHKMVYKYVKDMLKYYEKVEPFEKNIDEYKWWKINYDRRIMHRGFLPFFGYVLSIYSYNPYIYYMNNCYNLMNKYGHYIFGIAYDEDMEPKYYVYGVPGRYLYNDLPFQGMTGFVSWYPLEDKEPEKGDYGYWLLHIDAKTGNVVFPMKPTVPPMY